MKPSKHTRSHTAGLRVLRGQRNRCWQDRGSDTRVRFRVRQAYRGRINPPFFCGVDLAPGVASCSTMYLTKELWQLHGVVGSIDGGTIAGRWPRGLYSVSTGTKREGGACCRLDSEFLPPPHIGSSPPHFRSFTAANRDYLYRIDFPFQSSAPVRGSSYYAIACVLT